MKFDSYYMGFQGVAKIEQLRLDCILPAEGYRLMYELFHLSYLTEPFERFLCPVSICP